jgi:hypothetical protein
MSPTLYGHGTTYLPERSRRPDTALRVVAVLTLLATILGAQAVLAGISEGYCIAWPGIGTHFASGFSHLGFARVQPGMTQQQVRTLLGRPLTRGFNERPAPSGWELWRPGDETWSYSMDSSALGGDWAWLSREIVFRNGVVVQKVKWTFYD